MIKHEEYDGFIFNSALGKHDNYVIFDKDDVTFDSMKYANIEINNKYNLY
ncbi:hypothetical protein [Metabacillus idriensis]|nr:hypothetical protein [Metabacillus idriensis]